MKQITGPLIVGIGTCYGNHIGWSQAAAVQNTWYNISDPDMVSGPLRNVIHDGNGKLTITKPGIYEVSYTVCFEDTIANDHVDTGIEINGSGVAEGGGRGHSENKFANEEEHLSGVTNLELVAGDTIEIAIRTEDVGGPTISVQGLNLTCKKNSGR